MSVPITDSVAK